MLKLNKWVLAILYCLSILQLNAVLAADGSVTPTMHTVTEVSADSTPEIIDIIAMIVSRHPNLIQNQLTYGRNAIDLYKHVSLLKQQVQLNSDAFIIPAELPALSTTFTSTQKDIDYNNSGLSKLREDLLRAVESMERDAPNLAIKVISEVLKDSRLIQNRKLALNFLRILPLLYDIDGNPLDEVADKSISGIADKLKDFVRSKTGFDFSNLYQDAYQHHLHGIVQKQSPHWRQTAEIYQNQFIKKTLSSYLKLEEVGQQSQLKRVALSIEKVPPIIALMRGAVGYDCSMSSVPYYPLLPQTEVFWIRKELGLKSQPAGYVLVTKAAWNNKILPYVITINGSTLDAAHTRATIVLISRYYGVSEVIVPDFSENPVVVNDPAKAKGMAGTQKINVILNDEWKQIKNFESRQTGSHSDYYNPDKLQSAMLTTISNIELKEFSGQGRRFISKAPYTKKDVTAMSLFDRALLAAQANSHQTTLLIDVLNYLRINPYEKSLADKLLNLTPSTGLELEDIQRISVDLKISPQRLFRKISPYSLAYTLNNLRTNIAHHKDFSQINVNDLAVRTAQWLDGQLPQLIESGNTNILPTHWKSRQQLDGFSGVKHSAHLTEELLQSNEPKKVSAAIASYGSLDDLPLNIKNNLPELISNSNPQFGIEISKLINPYDRTISEFKWNLISKLIHHSNSDARLAGYGTLPKYYSPDVTRIPDDILNAVAQRIPKITKPEAEQLDIFFFSHRKSFSDMQKKSLRGVLGGNNIEAKYLVSIFYQKGEYSKYILENEYSGLVQDLFLSSESRHINRAIDQAESTYQLSDLEWNAIKPHLQAPTDVNYQTLFYLIGRQNTAPEWFWNQAPTFIISMAGNRGAGYPISSLLDMSFKRGRFSKEVFEAILFFLKNASQYDKTRIIYDGFKNRQWPVQVWNEVAPLVRSEKSNRQIIGYALASQPHWPPEVYIEVKKYLGNAESRQEEHAYRALSEAFAQVQSHNLTVFAELTIDKIPSQTVPTCSGLF